MTFETEPVALKILTPTWFLRAKLITVSIISEPAEISRITGFIAESLSLVITIGGLGLFLDPGGLPLGFLAVFSDDEGVC